MITEGFGQTYRAAPISNLNIDSSLSNSMGVIFENIFSFLFDKWKAIWLICRRLFLERAWSGLMTFLRKNEITIQSSCGVGTGGQSVFFYFGKTWNGKRYSFENVKKMPVANCYTFAVWLQSSNVFIFDIMWDINIAGGSSKMNYFFEMIMRPLKYIIWNFDYFKFSNRAK